MTTKCNNLAGMLSPCGIKPGGSVVFSKQLKPHFMKFPFLDDSLTGTAPDPVTGQAYSMASPATGFRIDASDFNLFPEPEVVISPGFTSYNEANLGNDETLEIYIETDRGSVNTDRGRVDSVGLTRTEEQYAEAAFNEIDPIIDADFVFVDNPNQAYISIYYVETVPVFLPGVVGLAHQTGDDWEIFVQDTGNNQFDANTFIHEIGHTLGLRHPNERPSSRLYDTSDTVMSYNANSNGDFDTRYSPTDIAALVTIWGFESDNGQDAALDSAFDYLGVRPA